MNAPLRAARVATFVYFSLCGTLMGTWVVNIPAIEERVGISHATLGGLLVLLGLGAFVGMQVAGRLTDSLGARVVVPTTGVLCSAALVLPGLPQDPWTLAAALMVFGFCNGCLDVSMNAHAVHVEKAYGRPVMSAFHATFSVGGVLAALVGAAAASAALSPAAGMAVMGALGVVVAGWCRHGRCCRRRPPLPTPTLRGMPTPLGRPPRLRMPTPLRRRLLRGRPGRRRPPRAAAPAGASGSSPPSP
ncbi:MFS transporter [Streptomyces sp. GLT-R25]